MRPLLLASSSVVSFSATGVWPACDDRPDALAMETLDHILTTGAKPSALAEPSSSDDGGGRGDVDDAVKHSSGRQCWVCFASEEDDAEAVWSSPCKCRGATKWVHQCCIQRWIDEKQNATPSVSVACPQCNADYVVIYPKHSRFVYVLDRIDRTILRVSPFLAAGIVMGSIYWSAVTFGAVTVLQVVGFKDGLKYMESSDPFFLLVGLPTIPTGLLLAKMVPWEECLLRVWLQRFTGPKFLGGMTSSSSSSGTQVVRMSSHEQLMNAPGFSDAVNATRVICSALLLPTISTLLGQLLFPGMNCGVQRAFLGAVVFSVVKGFLKIYLRHEQLVRQTERKVLDFGAAPEPNTGPQDV
ncbi:E3 ubiquitin-protein ligase MARCH5-like [Tropilaelaps mercedesae]|uniref:E3 ubiquitin-protein ligase MARCHF5 n=1 Tax=Tropilaelaps mercedesae TaxID=418985 RepID=A0A1V9XA54_9ACAR|nr:E3 ubiquitin-protein ligase MARCH5-like [Tropilaelaps mercedesae]